MISASNDLPYESDIDWGKGRVVYVVTQYRAHLDMPVIIGVYATAQLASEIVDACNASAREGDGVAHYDKWRILAPGDMQG